LAKWRGRFSALTMALFHDKGTQQNGFKVFLNLSMLLAKIYFVRVVA
jgi:hypothetical protein